jgi:hypothetical protein
MSKLYVPCTPTLSEDALLFAVARSLDRWGKWTVRVDRATPVLACEGGDGAFEVRCQRDPGGDGMHLSVSERRGFFGRLLGASAVLERLSGEVHAAASRVVGSGVKSLP